MLINKKNAWKLVLKRELNRIVSRPIYPIMVIFIPLAFLLYFGTLMSHGLPDRVPIGIIDNDYSSVSKRIIRQIKSTQLTEVTSRYLHFSEANDAVQRGEIFAFIEIPDKLQKDILEGKQPTINFYYNQSYILPGSLVLKNMSTMLTTISGGVNLETRKARGQNEAQSMGQILPVIPDFHAIGNPWTNYSVYLISVFLPALLQLMILLTTVYCIGIELKKNSSLKWYRISGKSITQSLFGKLIPYTIAFSVMGIFYEVFLFKFLHYPLNNQIGWMFLAIILMVLAAQAFGVFMIGVFPVLRDGLSFAGLYGVLAFSYTGLSFPINGMPAILQGLSYFFPMRWYYTIYQGIALNGLSPDYFLKYYVYIVIYLLLPFTIVKRLKKAMIEMNYPKK
jgi:ABC-2 type transport system permease protein